MLKRPVWEITREIRVKAEEETNSNYGCPPEERPLSQYIQFGMVVIDKTPGPTSHEVAAWVKKLLDLDKVGHGGTLDPKVTGVLPITLQDSTKIVQALLDSGKEYVCVMRTHEEVSEDKIRKTLDHLTGEIYQRPPLRSSVSRRLRTRYIYGIDFLEGDGKNWLYKVQCQSGTYIRKLCHDVGEIIGCGAHMQELRRTRSGPFTEADLYTLYDLSEALDFKEEGDDSYLRKMIRPYEDAAQLLPKIWIRDSAVEAVCNGAQLAVPGILRYEAGIEANDLIVAMTQKEEAVALMKADMSSGKIQAENHGIAATTERVLMPSGVYPKTW
ncbi:RNA-guided pseudouridylation complex pseudouridine synthase subunit Cbf5 [Candidatus Bathyarchaeota archaeon]|nr:RNA-guided pseudouridylation complex pseudouridine synthase subunit Cbf5 [Candidatus Bathyarchaeota archaeon]TFH18828.1 MAG: RNA-guided pseudouridylation complex pseudouridine synthase subunit Cbf5 [Candidatus Bathyarchaeota archaeon]